MDEKRWPLKNRQKKDNLRAVSFAPAGRHTLINYLIFIPLTYDENC
jgi:hypothetical protein